MREGENPSFCSDVLGCFKVEPDKRHEKKKAQGRVETGVLVPALPLTPWLTWAETFEPGLNKEGAPDGF